MKSIALILNIIVIVVALIIVTISGVQLNQIILVFIFFLVFILNIVSLIEVIDSGSSAFHSKSERVTKNIALLLCTLLLILGLFSVFNSGYHSRKQIAKAILFFPTLILTIGVITFKSKDTKLDLYFKKHFRRKKENQ
jgi:hypothetical protein